MCTLNPLENCVDDRARTASPPDLCVLFLYFPGGETYSFRLFSVSSNSLADLFLSKILYLTHWLQRIASFLLSGKLQPSLLNTNSKGFLASPQDLINFTHFPGVISQISLANMVIMRTFLGFIPFGLEAFENMGCPFIIDHDYCLYILSD